MPVAALAFVGCLLAASPIQPGSIPPSSAPPGGRSMLSDSPLDSIGYVGDTDKSLAAFTLIGQGQLRSLKIDTLKEPDLNYRIQTQFFFAQPVKTGDRLLATLAVRGTGTLGRQAKFEVWMGQFGDPWTAFSTLTLSADEKWQRISLKAIATQDFEPGKARFTINYGFSPQTVEITDVQVLNYGPEFDFSKLPQSQLSYAGRAPDAPWRKAAAARIDRIRKAPLTVEVVDRRGRPVPGAAVSVAQVESAFPHGMALSSRIIVRDKTPDGDRYREMAARHWKQATIDFDTVWAPWESWPDDWAANRRNADGAIDWLHQKGFSIHGCHIIWGGERWMPNDVAALAKSDPKAFRARMEAHIRALLTAYKGRVNEWNAVNEAYTEKLAWEALGESAIGDVFRLARAVDPSLKLGLNDYGDFANSSNAHINGYLGLLDRMKKAGVKMDVIGLQGHFGSNVRSPEEVYALADRFAKFGIPIHVSELDINVADEEFQADYLKDVHTILFSHPAVEKITQWGFWEGNHWLPQAALWRKDWTIKPSGRAWLKLVKEDWMTKASLRSDRKGAAQVRAFLGTYEVTATVGGRKASVKAVVAKPGAKVRVRLP